VPGPNPYTQTPLTQIFPRAVQSTGTAHGRPQLVLALCAIPSHPLLGSPSQSKNPGLQATNWHAPFTQLITAFGAKQMLPHAPQLLTSFCRSVSHPFAATPSQSPNPALHVATVQTPCTHAAVPLATLQMLPHAPQLLTSVERSRQVPEQTVWPAAQSSQRHVTVLKVCDGEQAVDTHAPPQKVSPAAQYDTQVQLASKTCELPQ
jgi:hypothetical protein